MHRPERLYSVNNKRVGVHGGIPLYTDVIKGLVFDMDGLLFDSERVVQQSWNYAGNLLGSGRTYLPHDRNEPWGKRNLFQGTCRRGFSDGTF